jgi:hypothetical protein
MQQNATLSTRLGVLIYLAETGLEAASVIAATAAAWDRIMSFWRMDSHLNRGRIERPHCCQHVGARKFSKAKILSG